MDKATPRRFEKNAPGPFYTTGECAACGAPEYEAPELLAALDDDNYETYFVRQPQTPEEVERACRAAEVCCLGTLRYGGMDAAVIRRLGNDPEYCDHLLPGGKIARPYWLPDYFSGVRHDLQIESIRDQSQGGLHRKRWWHFWRS